MARLIVFVAVFASLLAVPAQAQEAPPHWSKADAEEMLALVADIRSEGLDPADYPTEHLRAALTTGDQENLDRTASTMFAHLAADLSQGHVRARNRIGWHIVGPSIDERSSQALMSAALARHDVRKTLTALLPAHPEYRRLKSALAATPARDKAAVQRLRANLERWRWMPRYLGRRYILVNVPAFELTLVEEGEVVARHRVIVGKPRTPTPQFSAAVRAVQFNPWWHVPSSIVAESVGKLVRTNPKVARNRGYVWSGGKISQRPGPGNALGQVKLLMPNPFTIYIHDTPTKKLFDEEVRAFSHGCIRTQDATGLAEKLLKNPAWGTAAIEQLLSSRATTDAVLELPVPVYVSYFTAATDASGELASYPDIYGRDGPVVASLIDREPADVLAGP